MDPSEAGVVIKKLDRRLERVEQILPTLPTRDELQAAIAPLVTEEKLQAAIAPLATKEELRAAIAPLATRDYVAEEGARTRRHFDVVAERMRDDIKLVAEGHAALRRHATETDRTLKEHDRRLNRLETPATGARRTKKR